MEPYGLHWFRRDLRVAGNPALQWNWKRHNGRVVGIFFFDKKFLNRPDFSPARFHFFLATLKALHDELLALGSDLLFLDVGPLEAFPSLLEKLVAIGKGSPKTISWNRDYEPFARERDNKMERFLKERGIDVHTERDHLLIEPTELFKKKDPSDGYQVYTPFSKKWKDMFSSGELDARIKSQAKGIAYRTSNKEKSTSFHLTWKELGCEKSDLLETYQRQNASRVTISIPEAGSHAALQAVHDFKERIGAYATDRDIPSVRGTSGFSIFLKNGSLTVAQILAALDLRSGGKDRTTVHVKFLNELIWREFYYHILWRYPDVEKHAFQRRFETIPWENREDFFQAWKDGRTGYPIVDAGMRQLNQTGWMHNRVRMIVASFLTKDLLIDWRWGERYFMEKLLDGDLAPNNGGWQWAASTGCDPQPYFRIFNPELQSTTFDPEGTYIKKYVPELRHLDAKNIHAPSHLLRGDYPPPLVHHGERRQIALAAYKKAAELR